MAQLVADAYGVTPTAAQLDSAAVTIQRGAAAVIGPATANARMVAALETISASLRAQTALEVLAALRAGESRETLDAVLKRVSEAT